MVKSADHKELLPASQIIPQALCDVVSRLNSIDYKLNKLLFLFDDSLSSEPSYNEALREYLKGNKVLLENFYKGGRYEHTKDKGEG